MRRQRLPKNDVGDFWSWKDLNVAMNLPCYGRVFRLYDCDRWTRVGIDVRSCRAEMQAGNIYDVVIIPTNTMHSCNEGMLEAILSPHFN